MKLIEISIKRPVTVIVGILFTTIFGYLSLIRIPIQLKPKVDKPIITVSTAYPGAAPQEVEDQITNPMEEKFNSVENLKEIRSTSSEGQSTIILEFEWGVNKDLASIDVLKKLNLVSGLPEDAEESIISAISREESRPIMYLPLVTNKTPNQTREIAEDIIKPRFERVPGVGAVDIYGGQEREIRITLDFKAMEARRVTVEDVINAVKRENRNVRGGHIDDGKKRLIVRTVGQFKSLEEIERVIVTQRENSPVYIQDIAQVEDTFKDKNFEVKINGHSTIVFPISKKEDENTIQVSEAVLREMDRLNRELSYKGIQIKSAYSSADYIWEAIDHLKLSLALGALLAAFVLFIFLRHLYFTFIISLTIPISMIATFIFLNLTGRSINIISLAGLGFAVGMVVDNAIVVLENIFRHLQMKKSSIQAAFDGTVEVWGAILASTLTTLAVFIPIVFIKEEAGQLFKDIALTISYAVGLSLLVSITVIPMLSSKEKKTQPRTSESALQRPLNKTLDSIHALAGTVQSWVISTVQYLTLKTSRSLTTVLIIIIAFVATWFLLPSAEYLPAGNRNLVLTSLDTPPGTNLKKVEEISDQALKPYLKMKEADRIFSVVSDTFQIIGIIFKKEYKDNLAPYIQKMREMTRNIAGARLFVFQANIFQRGQRGGKTIEINIRGDDLMRLEALSREIENEAKQISGVINTDSSFKLGNPELQVIIDRDRASNLAVSAQEVAQVVEILVAGRKISVYRKEGSEYDLTLRGAEKDFLTSGNLEEIRFTSKTGKTIHLSSVASVVRTEGPTEINHIELDRSITLTLFVDRAVPIETVMNELDRGILHRLRSTLPQTYSIDLSGSADDLTVTRRALTGSFILAIIIIYLLISALFESFLYPLIIMFTVPLAATGAILGIWITRTEFNVITMLGFIILSGIVVNMSILLVHQTRNFINQGLPPEEAIIESTRTRIRPIFMSTTTSILGMLPLTMGHAAGTELYKGLGAAIIGGLTFSTLFTLILTPVLLSLFLRIRKTFLTGFTG